jgi:hypothetical protein
MQAKTEISGPDLTEAKYIWGKAKEDALHWAAALASRLEVHKQIANRITEPWMTMKTVVSGTEWRNFWWLRCHADAQPEINVLAQKMFELYKQHQPQQLQPGEWHVPYVNTRRDIRGNLHYLDSNDACITTEEARIVSASCCAQVSYRKQDDTLEKATKIYRQLIESEPAHASPVEHQATPMHPHVDNYDPSAWQPGTTHLSANGDLWSGNLRGWIQHRKLITGEAKW